MAKTVLLLRVRADLLETVKQELHMPGIEFLGGIDHVIIGGGLDLEPGPRWSGRCSSRATVRLCT
jgi:hypothetical protein